VRHRLLGKDLVAFRDSQDQRYAALHLVPALLLLGAIASWPYGYYTALRFVVCVTAGWWLAAFEYRRSNAVAVWAIVLCLVAILFNPLVPVFLTRGIWFVLDLAAAAIFVRHLWTRPQNG